MKQKLKLMGNTTSGQIFISSMLVMAIAFLCIGGYLYKICPATSFSSLPNI